MKLLNILLEEVITKDKFYLDNNIDPDNLSYLGRGDFGIAYSIGNSRVLKKTTSSSEFNYAKELIGRSEKVLEPLAKVYQAESIEGKYYIIVEEVDTGISEIENLYYQMNELLEEQYLPIEYVGNLDTEDKDIDNDLIDFIDSIYNIIGAYNYLGVERPDIKPDNLGYRSNGMLVAFDIDSRR